MQQRLERGREATAPQSGKWQSVGNWEVIVLGCYTVTFNGNLAQEREVILSQKKEKEKKKGKRKKKKIELGWWIKLCLKFPTSLKKILWSNQFIWRSYLSSILLFFLYMHTPTSSLIHYCLTFFLCFCFWSELSVAHEKSWPVDSRDKAKHIIIMATCCMLTLTAFYFSFV